MPAIGTGSWAGFTPARVGAMLMGDVLLLPAEIGPVQQTALKHGLHMPGFHNHVVGDEPEMMFMTMVSATPTRPATISVSVSAVRRGITRL